jgi:hypothetical protein
MSSSGYQSAVYLTEKERRAIQFLKAAFPDIIFDVKIRPANALVQFSWKFTCVRDSVENEIYTFEHPQFIGVFMLVLKQLCEKRRNKNGI